MVYENSEVCFKIHAQVFPGGELYRFVILVVETNVVLVACELF